MHLDELFISLAVILSIASVTTIIFKWLRQPLVLGYILAGILTGSQLMKLGGDIIDNDSITLWGEIGVIFLLFGLGLEFNFKKLRKVGRGGAITATLEALFMIPVGYAVGQMMGWSVIESIFLGGMLSISSTSIVIKAFDDLNLKSRRFTQVVFGVLIAEDIMAVVLMVMLSSIGATQSIDGEGLLREGLMLMLFIFLWFSGGIYIIPTLLRKLRRLLTDEIVLIVTLGLCFAMVVVAAKSGFSTALGAFLMGVIIAETDEQERILRLITPIRQLFGAVFFISVGMLVNPSVLIEYWQTILIISLVVLFVKPLVVTIGLMISGRTVKMAVQSGFSLAQIGEFSFIIASVGLSLGVIYDKTYPIIVSVSVITTFATPYFMRYALPALHRVLRFAPNSWREMVEHQSVRRVKKARQKLSSTNIKTNSSHIGVLLVNLVWLIAITLFSISVFTPFVYQNLGNHWSIKLNIIVVSLLVMSPFTYAVVSNRNRHSGTVVYYIIRYVISGLLILLVINKQLENIPLSLGVTAIYLLLFIGLSSSLPKLYHMMEQRFMLNLDKSRKHKRLSIPEHLDSELHSELFIIPLGSIISGHTISSIYKKFNTGVQILSIHRRQGEIKFPSNTHTIHSDDRVMVIGNEEQILHFKCCVESIDSTPRAPSVRANMELTQLTITSDSPLIGCKANVSALRERFDFILVGYDINGEGFTRPNPKHKLVEGDIIWIVK